MDRRTRAATLIVVALAAATAAVVVTARTPVAEAAMSPFERLAHDSAMGDAEAFETLPPRLADLLDLRDHLTVDALASLPSSECVVLDPDTEGEFRRRLTMRMPDSGSVVIYTTAVDSSGSLQRVEFIRRLRGLGQRGLIWDAQRDHTSSMWWSEPERGARRRVDRGDIPRGGPVPRVLRALGRRLLTLPCEDQERTHR